MIRRRSAHCDAHPDATVYNEPDAETYARLMALCGKALASFTGVPDWTTVSHTRPRRPRDNTQLRGVA